MKKRFYEWNFLSLWRTPQTSQVGAFRLIWITNFVFVTCWMFSQQRRAIYRRPKSSAEDTDSKCRARLPIIGSSIQTYNRDFETWHRRREWDVNCARPWPADMKSGHLIGVNLFWCAHLDDDDTKPPWAQEMKLLHGAEVSRYKTDLRELPSGPENTFRLHL